MSYAAKREVGKLSWEEYRIPNAITNNLLTICILQYLCADQAVFPA